MLKEKKDLFLGALVNQPLLILVLIALLMNAEKLADDIFFLVHHHETGGTKGVDILRDADSISLFHVNLPYYFLRNSVEETKKRCLWGYRKLPDSLIKVVAEFDYQNKELELLVRTCIHRFTLH